MHLEVEARTHREEPGERAREPIELGLHNRELLVLEYLDVAFPDQILGVASGRRYGPSTPCTIIRLD